MKSHLLTLCFFLFSINIVAQNSKETIQLKGHIVDQKTRKDLAGATVQLLTADSVVIDQQTPIQHWQRNGQEGYSAIFTFTVPKQSATYIFRASFLGYKTTCVTYVLGDLKQREHLREIPKIMLREDSKLLKEVSVTASKVKFYHRGDTVVYNADAFVLAEGSMLDALVQQMPGVEIKSDGRIYHNGKFVESLLLNGKDFFKGDNSVMLDNLPAYTVKQVEIYDKYGKKSELLGEQRQDDKRYVMDVRLKKEHSVGMLANIEGGYGTEDRWLARLFAMRQTLHSRLSLYGNMNNLNDSRKPGQDNGWTPEQMAQGEAKEKIGGLDYSISDRNGRYELNGNVQLSHHDQNLTTNQDLVNFLSQGDTYEYSRSNSRSKNFNLSTSHFIDIMRKNFYLHLEPTFNYQHYENSGALVSAAFSTMQSDVNREILANLYSNNVQSGIRRALINHLSKNTLNKGNIFDGNLAATATVKFNSSSDYIDLSANMTGNSTKDEGFNRYAIRYGADGQTGAMANQYFKNKPQRIFYYNAFATYVFRMNKQMEITFGYGLEHWHRESHSSLYLLDTLSTSPIGVLPSVAEYESKMDYTNSYVSTTNETAHNAIVGMEWRKQYPKGSLYLTSRFYLKPTHQHLDYQRGVVDTTVVRNSVQWAAPQWIVNWSNKDHSFSSQLMLDIQSKTPELVNMVNFTDNTNPLNIRIGNPQLKNQQTYSLIGLISKTDRERQSSKYVRLEYKTTNNALAMGYNYDATTGIRTYRAENVDGNWNAGATVGYVSPLGKSPFTLTSNSHAEYLHSVDLIGNASSGSDYMTSNSAVGTTSLSQELCLNYKLGSSSTIDIKGNFAWLYTNSNRTDFSRINAFNFNYGIRANLQLPWKFQLSTDFTVFSRRGYEGSTMNTDNLIWNARLSRSIMKGRFTVMLDGFDILGQLDNVTRYVNAQGRTEICTNVLPSYALFHVVYHFNKQPKK